MSEDRLSADMLGLEMEMEAELGIDSIKQVEILGTVSRYRAPRRFPVPELASMRTLQDVVNSIAGFDGGSATTAKPLPQHLIRPISTPHPPSVWAVPKRSCVSYRQPVSPWVAYGTATY